MTKTVCHVLIAVMMPLAFTSVSFAQSKEKKRAVAQEVIMLVDDVVFKLQPSENGYRVLFRTHAAIYHLRSDSKYYEQILRILNTSKTAQERVKLQVDSNTMEIKEVAIQTK
jgi:hypothetical protein